MAKVDSALMAELNNAKQGRNSEQCKVIHYFYGIPQGGCMGFGGKLMSDKDYDKMVEETLEKNNYFKDKAIAKIGLDESEISLIQPVCIQGYWFDEKKAYAKYGSDFKWRSSAYQVSWLFFSETQVYLYQHLINFDEASKKESCEEYFYKDVVNFASSEETVEKKVYVPTKGCFGKEGAPRVEMKSVETVRLSIVVPGDKMYCSATVTDDAFENSIKGMKALLREKKNNG